MARCRRAPARRSRFNAWAFSRAAAPTRPPLLRRPQFKGLNSNAPVLQAPAAVEPPAPDENEFPTLGAGGSGFGGPGGQAQGKRKGKRGKGQAMDLNAFQQSGSFAAKFASNRDKATDKLANLPTHATGIEHGDPLHYRSGASINPRHSEGALCELGALASICVAQHFAIRVHRQLERLHSAA